MFDGNHRIRKEINLGSRARRNRARTTTQAKTDLLETARKQREARAEAQRRTNSATKVQRTYRGHSSRRRLGRELASLAIDGGRLDAAEVLSLRLSDPLLPHWPDDDDDDGDGEGEGNIRTAAAAEGQKKTKKKRQRNNYRKTVGALLEYAPQFDPSKVATVAGDGSAGSVGMAAMEEEDVRSGDESLTVVSKSAVEPTAGARWAVASSRIARASLALLLIDGLDDDLTTAESAATLSDLVARLCHSSPSVLTKLATVGSKDGGDEVAPLFLAFRMWFWRVDVDVPDGPDGGGSPPSPTQRWTVDVARTLLRLSSEAVREGGSAVGAAGGSSVLAAVLLGTRDLRRHPLYADAAADAASGSTGGGDYHAGWWLLLVEALVRCLDNGGNVEGGAGSGFGSGSTAGAIVAGRELVVLSNVIDLLWNDGKFSSSTVDGQRQRIRVVDAVLRSIRHVVARRPDLAHLAGVAALRGTGAVDEWAAAAQRSGSVMASAMSVDGEGEGEDETSSSDNSSDDRDYDEEAAATSASGGGGGGGASGLSSVGLGQRGHGHGQGQRRLTRSDLQTTKALDVLVQGENARGRRDALSSASAAADDGGRGEESSLLVSLASALGGGDLLLRLGGEVARSAAAVDVGGGAAAARGRWEAYGEVLFVVSRTCSGLRTSSSPLLSALAFAPGPSNVVLDGLWNVASSSPVPQQAQAQRGGSRKPPAATTARGGDDDPSSASHRMMAMTAFCDVFAHRLLAMDDEEFVATYVSEAHSGGGGSLGGAGSDATIRPDGVVTWLGRILHGLYWTDPVVSSDVVSNSGGPTGTSEGDRVVTSTGLVRTRLLLSGTKLYNSLYERWCRMETPFCGEECWWWPKLVSTSMHRARSAGRGGGGDGDLVIRVDDDGGSTGVAGMDVEETFYDDDIDDDDSDAEMEDASAGRRRGGRGRGAGAGSTMTTQDEENEALAASFRDPKMARVLTACPQAVPFQRRVAIFQSMLDADKYRTQNEMVSLRSLMMNGDLGSSLPGRVQVRVRRDEIYRDSMDQLNALGPRLREKVQVTLVNRHGTEESGIDGGGLFKEFLDDLISEAFDPGKDWALFAVSPLETLFVNTNRSSVGGSSEGLSNAKMLEQYEFLGRVLGKAVYESILVEPQFGLPFLNKLLGKQNTLDDLKKLDPEVYRHLRSIRRMDNVADLGLTFEVTSSVDARGNPVSGGGLRTIPLCPNGGSIPVTKRNAIQYVHLLAHHKLNVEGSPQTRAFLRGFRDLIPAAWVRLFSARELQKLISGDDAVRGIDVDGLRQCMQYAGGYHPSQPIIVWFWEVVREMTPDQQRKLLRFVTSCSRQPLLGFRALNPLPCVQQVRVGDAAGDAKLPTSSTCMNLLKLPNYDSKELLREKLLYSVESGAGFELT